MARQGKARQGKARQGKAYTVCPHFKQRVIRVRMLEVKEKLSLCLPCNYIEM